MGNGKKASYKQNTIANKPKITTRITTKVTKNQDNPFKEKAQENPFVRQNLTADMRRRVHSNTVISTVESSGKINEAKQSAAKKSKNIKQCSKIET